MKKSLFALLFLFSSQTLCQSACSELEKQLNGLHTMKASFTQIIRAKNRILSNSTGSMAIQRPGRFRWQINAPLEQLLIARDKTLWVYDKELEQVTVKKQKNGLEGPAALFLSDHHENLSKDFEILSSQKNEDLVFNLKAKSAKANFERIQLAFNQHKLRSLKLHDSLGQTTIIHFNQIELNEPLAPDLFHLNIPKGVDVIHQ